MDKMILSIKNWFQTSRSKFLCRWKQ